MRRFAPALLALLLVAGLACKKSAEETPGSSDIFSTPEKAFQTVKKGLVNRDADLLWDSLSRNMVKLFDDGRKEFLAQPLEEKKRIATEGMARLEEIEKADTKGFFKFYFQYKKREVYRMNSAELLDRKVEAIRSAKISSVTYQPEGTDAAKATKAYVLYEMSGEEYMLPFVKEGADWRVDQMDEPRSLPE